MMAYAVAAAGAIVATPPAHASIVFTPANQVITRGVVLNIDLNQDGVPDFTLNNYLTGSDSFYYSHLTVVGDAGAAGKVIGRKIGGRLSAWDAPPNWSIGPNSPNGFVDVSGKRAQMLSGAFTSRGPWRHATNKFLGFQFTINGETHYGWARLSASFSITGLKARLTGFAYETQPNTAILAGDRGTVAETTRRKRARSHEPTLALLGLGSAGLDVWRQGQNWQ